MPDYDFQQPEPPDQPPVRRPSYGVLIAIGVAAIAIGALAAYFWTARQTSTEPAPQTQAQPPTAPLQPETAAGPEDPQYDLPPLEDSDEFMRDRVGELSEHPLVRTWLGADDLVRNLAVVLENTSRGLTPSMHLRALRPTGAFRVVQQGDRLVIDTRSYERFNGIAAAAASIDPGAAATLYTGIKPLLQLAYRQLGSQEPVDRALERSLAGLLRAPVVEGNVAVVRGNAGVGYQYADPRLESLSAAQKQLIRMGPANQQTIQDQLLRFAAAAGITVR